TLDASSVAASADADAILFFSPSAVHAFVALVEHGVLSAIAESTGIGAIGPVTKENLLKEARMRCDFAADETRVDEIIEGLEACLEEGTASAAGAPARCPFPCSGPAASARMSFCATWFVKRVSARSALSIPCSFVQVRLFVRKSAPCPASFSNQPTA